LFTALANELFSVLAEHPWTCHIHSLERWFVGVEWCRRQPEHLGIKSQNNKVNIVTCSWHVCKTGNLSVSN